MGAPIPVAIVGGGQAGLSVSYALRQHGIEHVVFDRGQVGDTWRLRRWDSFMLVTPNWQCRLPGFAYDGDDPNGFMNRAEILGYIERYAEFAKVPFEAGVEVTRVQQDGSHHVLHTSKGEVRAENVVMATGAQQEPFVPFADGQVPEGVTTLHSVDYRSPGALPDGAVLVVGSGQSGCQIAEDLLRAGRRVFLSSSRTGRLPRRYRGQDILTWFNMMGLYTMKVDQHPAGRDVRNIAQPHLSGRGPISPRRLRMGGAVVTGGVEGFDGTTARFRDDLADNLAFADGYEDQMLRLVDDYIDIYGAKAGPPDHVDAFNADMSAPESIDLEAEDVRTIVWATGYRLDFSLIDAPVVDASGMPKHIRGVSAKRGLYFIGLHWLHIWGSGLFLGVGVDAFHIAEHIAARR